VVQRCWVHCHPHPEPACSAAHRHGTAAEQSPADRYPEPSRGGIQPVVRGLSARPARPGLCGGKRHRPGVPLCGGAERAAAGAGRRAGPSPGGPDGDQQWARSPGSQGRDRDDPHCCSDKWPLRRGQPSTARGQHHRVDPWLTDKSEACPSTLLRSVYTLFGTTVFQGGSTWKAHLVSMIRWYRS
jgi:hypothetical protein